MKSASGVTGSMQITSHPFASHLGRILRGVAGWPVEAAIVALNDAAILGLGAIDD